MTEPLAPSIRPVFHSCREPAAAPRGASPGAFARPFDPYRFRALFPDRWSGFLRRHYRDAVEVAFFFDVDEKTARNWLDGVTGPRGAAVCMAMMRHPAAARRELLQEAA